MNTNKRFLALDSFRGISAICVAIYHINVTNSITELNFFKGSYIFVEFFFVLSGFVLAHAYSTKNITFKRFFISRSFRIFPLHIFMLLIFIALELCALIAYKYGINLRGVPFTGKTGVYEILPNLLLLQAWTKYTYEGSFNGPSWSISVEYYIYLIYFVTLLFSKHKRTWVWLLIPLTIAVFHNTDFMTKSVNRGIFSFFLGALTYLVHTRFPKFSTNKVVINILEIGLFLMVVAFASVELDEDTKFKMAGFLFALVIFIYSFEAGHISSLIKHKHFLLLGTLSYSIYLTHYFIIVIVKSLCVVIQQILNVNITYISDDSRYINFGNAYLDNFFIVLFIGLIIYISTFTYKYIEQKGQNYGRSIIARTEQAR